MCRDRDKKINHSCFNCNAGLSIVFWFVLAILPGQVTAEEIWVAVAGNFTAAMTALAQRFEANTGHKVTLMFDSTGKHYAQIKSGAPFDAYFAVDVKRPALLEEEGVALPGSRSTYATGRLVLWSPDKSVVDSGGQVLEAGTFRHLAIANPKLAPYGRAAQEVLQVRGVWKSLQATTVRGELSSRRFCLARAKLHGLF